MNRKNLIIVVVGILLALPFVATMYMLILQKSAEIETSELEVMGAKYHAALFDLMLSAQDHRGKSYLTSAQKNANKTQEDIATLKTAIQKKITRVAEVDREFGAPLGTKKQWTMVRHTLEEAVTDTVNGTPADIFEKRTTAIALLTNLMDEVATSSKLVLDPDFEPYYLMIILTQAFPDIVKNTGYLRGKVSGLLASGNITSVDMLPLVEKTGRIGSAVETYQYAFSVLADRSDEPETQEQENKVSLFPKLAALLQMLQSINTGSKTNHQNFYSAATDVISASTTIYTTTQHQMLQHINARIDSLKWDRMAILVSTAILSIATVIFFLFTIRFSVRREELDNARRLQELHDVIEKVQAVVEFNMDGTIITANDNFLAVMGYQLKEILGKHHSIFMDTLQKDSAAYQEFWKNLQAGTSQSGEFMRLSKNGDELWLQGNYSPVLDPQGKPYKIIKLAMDVTRRRKAENSSQAKSEFLSNMSHELRTPLNSILGMTQLLQDEPLSDDAKEMLNDIRQSSDNLLGIVNDILDLSKIEARMVHLEYKAFDISARSRSFVNGLLPMASQKGLHLDFSTDVDALYVKGDPLRFNRILANLVSNALRFTEKGMVNVAFTTQINQDGTVILRGEVRDTGIGITKEAQERIFNKFVQADTTTTRKYGGTGLGLAITKELVELMGGRIGVQSHPGKGSTFWFEIPFEICEKPAADEQNTRNITIHEDAIPARDARILAVEDHVMNQRFLQKLFKSLGVKQLKIVDNGLTAVHEAATGTYDLILMDCHLPEMNGYDATAAIRKLQDHTRSQIPIVAMTANAMSGDEALCLNSGMNSYISKPIDINKLISILSRWINFISPEALPGSSINAPSSAIDVNLDNLRANCMGDDAFLKEMCALFVTQGAAQIAQLRPLCTDGENRDWVEVSHSLKGTAGHIGAEKMRELCAQAQLMATATASGRKAHLEIIESEYLKAKNFLIQERLYVET